MPQKYFLSLGILVFLFQAAAVAQSSTSKTTYGGSWCHCESGEARCTDLSLRFRPYDGSTRASYLQSDGVIRSIPITTAVPAIVIQIVRKKEVGNNTFAQVDPVLSIDGPSAALNVFINGSKEAAASTYAVDGEFTISDLVFQAKHVGDVSLNFTTSAGLSLLLFPVRVTAISKISRDPELRFARFSSYFVSQANANPTHVIIGRPLPRIVIEIGAPENIDPDQEIVVTAQYTQHVGNVSLAGNVAVVNVDSAVSEAIFTSLALGNGTLENTDTFFIFSAKGYSLQSQVFRTMKLPVSNFRMRFASLSHSSISEVATVCVAQVGIPMHPIVIEIVDSSYTLDRTSTNLFVSVSSAGAKIANWTETRPVRDGSVTFEGIIFESLANAGTTDIRTYYLTFTAGTQSGLPVGGTRIFSPAISVSSVGTVNQPVFIRFRPFDSWVTYEGQPMFAVKNVVVPPIAVELVGRDGRVITTKEEMNSRYAEISVTCTPETALSGTTTVEEVEGVALFTNLKFADTVQPNLEFKLRTGLLNTIVASVVYLDTWQPAAVMRFEPSSTSRIIVERADMFAQRLVALPPIVIEILDAAGNVDSSCDELVVTAESRLLASGLRSVAQDGRVVFDHIVFAASGSTRLIFTAVSPGYLVSGKTLSTGFINIEEDYVPRFGLKFHGEGYVTSEHQPINVASLSAIPAIGVVVCDTQYKLDASPRNTVIRVTPSAGTLSPAAVTEVAVVEGVAWFRNIIFSKVAKEGILTFTAHFTNVAPEELIESYVNGKSIVTGRLYEQLRGQPNELVIAELPTILADHTQITSKSSRLFFTPFTVFQVNLKALQLSGVEVGSDIISNTVVTASATVPTNGSVVPYTSGAATFSELQLRPDTFIDGYFTLLTFTSSLAALKYNPLRVGPLYYDALQTDMSEPVIVAEVLMSKLEFKLARWVAKLVEIMKVDPRRIEITRVQQGGSAVSGFDYEWRGMRVEFKFLSPTTEDSEKVGSLELANLFLARKEDCNSAALKIRSTYFCTDDQSCDLRRLDLQLRGAERCVSTSSADERCNCYVPLFKLMGDRCKQTLPLMGICSQVRRCTSSIITDPCFTFEAYVYLQYLIIAGYTLLGVGLIALLVAWRRGVFSRLNRTKLKKKSGKKAGQSLTQNLLVEVDPDPLTVL